MVFPSSTTVNSPVQLALVTIGRNANSPVRFVENCAPDSCTDVVFSAASVVLVFAVLA